VVSGGVFPLDDGRTAHVRSQSDATVSHLVNGTCDCKATQYHAAPCAHRLAFRVYQRTIERLTEEEERWEPALAPEPLPPLPQPLYEAPTSINVRLTIAGRDCQVTLRGMDELEVLARLERLLARYPLSQPSTPQVASQGQDVHWCRAHQVAMQQQQKAGRQWYSHLIDGQWCKGK